jgi:hypothetical protein
MQVILELQLLDNDKDANPEVTSLDKFLKTPPFVTANDEWKFSVHF